MLPSDHSPYLLTALRAAKLAEKIIMEYYEKDIETDFKADNSPVTIADKEAEKIILKTLKESFPDHGFLGEEYGKDHFEKEYVWVIDPIDGTKKFRRQIPFFATEIALMRGNEVIVGVSNAPAMQECVYAEKNKGAFIRKNWDKPENDVQIYVSKIQELSQAYLQHEGLKHFVKRDLIEPLLELSRENLGFGGIGDAWTYHLLATGKVDAILGSHVKVWDYAPFACIIPEAGGKITDLHGKVFSQDIETILASNGLIHTEIIKIFNT